MGQRLRTMECNISDYCKELMKNILKRIQIAKSKGTMNEILIKHTTLEFSSEFR